MKSIETSVPATSLMEEPWRISTDSQGFHSIRTGERNEHPDSDLVADVYHDDCARLMVAAPDLYAALGAYLKAQCRMLECWADGDEAVKNGLWRNLHACEEAARAALAKVQS